jgi:hypothetical protein
LDEFPDAPPRHLVEPGNAQDRQIIDETPTPLAKKLTLELRF